MSFFFNDNDKMATTKEMATTMTMALTMSLKITKVDQHLEQFEVLLPSPTTFAFARWIFQVVDQLCEVEEKSKWGRKAGSRCQICSLNFCIEDKIYLLITLAVNWVYMR